MNPQDPLMPCTEAHSPWPKAFNGRDDAIKLLEDDTGHKGSEVNCTKRFQAGLPRQQK